MLHEWLSDNKHLTKTDINFQLKNALRDIGRDDVITQCMTDRQQVLVDDVIRQQAINDLVQRTYTLVRSQGAKTCDH